MFEIKVVVEVPGLPDALNNLARAMAGGVNIPVTANAAPASVAAPAVIPAASQNATVHPETLAAQAQAPVQGATQAAPAPAAEPTAPRVTMDEIARAGAALVDQGKMSALIDLLKNFGVPAVTQLREEQLPGFAAGLRALGAKI